MIFGSPTSIALEAALEIEGEYSPVLGRNLVGRVRLFLQDRKIGDFDDPCCVLGTVSSHLTEICSRAAVMWHPALAEVGPKAQFEILDSAVYGNTDHFEAEPNFTFLTNVSEAFDPIKAFILHPPGEDFHILIRMEPRMEIESFKIAVREMASVASEFAAWIGEQESKLLV